MIKMVTEKRNKIYHEKGAKLRGKRLVSDHFVHQRERKIRPLTARPLQEGSEK